MYDARAVANFFLDRAEEKGVPITPMTLLKVLYFAHGEHLAAYEKELVGQPFEAWQYGPVNRVVYDQLKHLKGRPIKDRLQSFDPTVSSFVHARVDFDEMTTKFLSQIFDYYSHYHALKLSELTHEEGSPWDQVWKEAEKQAVPGMIIPNRLIMAWFKTTGGGTHAHQSSQRRIRS